MILCELAVCDERSRGDGTLSGPAGDHGNRTMHVMLRLENDELQRNDAAEPGGAVKVTGQDANGKATGTVSGETPKNNSTDNTIDNTKC